MKSYVTIQSSEGSGQSDMGAVNRDLGWSNLPNFVNIRCHIQEKSRETVTDEYARVDEEGRVIIYHQNKDLKNYKPRDDKNQTQLRIIYWKANPNSRISFPVNDNDVEILEFKGHIEQVGAMRGRKKFFVLRAERNTKWKL